MEDKLMSITFYTENGSFDFNVANTSASKILIAAGQIDIVKSGDWFGELTVYQARNAANVLEGLSFFFEEDTRIDQESGQATIIHCGYSRERILRYANALRHLAMVAERDNTTIHFG
jgi:hypothetical protein